MRIIITESKINTIISKYIDKMFNDINYSYGYDDDGNEVDYAIEFYVGDYDDDDTIFRWYSEDYWDIEDDTHNLNSQKKKDESPILDVYDNNELIIGLIDTFGSDLWKEPLIKWFEEKFDLSVKTLELV
jgi:hypothetical protein